MIMKKKTNRGFTLIEVALFLAITGVLLIGFLAATWSSISRQRANDLIQSFSDFLRSQYSAVTSIQNNGGGNSGKAIYGKVITFGEKEHTVYVYDLIGDVKSSDELVRMNIPEMLSSVGADIVSEEKLPTGTGSTYTVYNQVKYELAYDASVTLKNATSNLEKAALLIVRSPQSGGIHTYFFSREFKIQDTLTRGETEILPENERFFNFNSGNSDDFRIEDVDFCLEARELIGDRKYDIRLKRDSANATGVNVINLDSDDNRCEN